MLPAELERGRPRRRRAPCSLDGAAPVREPSDATPRSGLAEARARRVVLSVLGAARASPAIGCRRVVVVDARRRRCSCPRTAASAATAGGRTAPAARSPKRPAIVAERLREAAARATTTPVVRGRLSSVLTHCGRSCRDWSRDARSRAARRRPRRDAAGDAAARARARRGPRPATRAARTCARARSRHGSRARSSRSPAADRRSSHGLDEELALVPRRRCSSHRRRAPPPPAPGPELGDARARALRPPVARLLAARGRLHRPAFRRTAKSRPRIGQLEASRLLSALAPAGGAKSRARARVDS